MVHPAFKEEEISSRSKGNSLELAVDHIFSVAGFKTERNVFIANYEIDVKATIGDRQIFIECKNYQNGSLSVRNLIHQWSSKNEILRAHKIIMAITGVKISDADYSLASGLDIEIWNQDDLTELFNLSLRPDQLRSRLIEKIDLRPLTIAERYRDDITYLVIKPLLSESRLSKDELFWYFNHYLRGFILTELQLSETTAQERAKLIELFEGNKKKKEFFNLITKKRTPVDYWLKVEEQLKSNNLLSRDRQDAYLSYMANILREYEAQKEFFNSGDYLARTKKLIAVRLQNALLSGQECDFRVAELVNRILVDLSNLESVTIKITGINFEQSQVLNWIMTSQSLPSYNSEKEVFAYEWECSSLSDTCEKVYRILTEYAGINSSSKLYDRKIE